MARVYLVNQNIVKRVVEYLEAGYTEPVLEDYHGRYLDAPIESYSWFLFGRNPPELVKHLRAQKKLLCSVPVFTCDNLLVPNQDIYTARLCRWDVSVTIDLYRDNTGVYRTSPVRHHKETYTLAGTELVKKKGVLRKTQHYYCLMLHRPLIARFMLELKHHGWLYDAFQDYWMQTGVDYALDFTVQ